MKEFRIGQKVRQPTFEGEGKILAKRKITQYYIKWSDGTKGWFNKNEHNLKEV